MWYMTGESTYSVGLGYRELETYKDLKFADHFSGGGQKVNLLQGLMNVVGWIVVELWV